MKKSVFFLIILFTGVFQSIGQSKLDCNWLFGSSPYLDLQGVEGSVINYINNRKIDTLRFYDSVASNNACISDKNGNLLFYFTGCRIIDSTQQIMDNGDSLNYGKTWDKFCGRFSRYPGTQNSILLPDPGYKDGYYLIHKRRELVTEPPIQTYIPDLYYSYIDIALNEGCGAVIKKNKKAFKTSNIVNGYLTACQHKNGKDWWIIQMKRDTNMYFKVLITADTIMAVDSQSIGPNFSVESNVGQAVFSPDGNKWALYNAHDDLLVYDFDRESGDLSNLQHVTFQDSAFYVGLAISSNSRYAYLCAKYDLYQVDLWADNIQSTIIHIDHVDGFTDPSFLSTFGQAQLAPDCKIYIVSSATNNYLHVINQPNEKGKACDFQQHSLYLPNRNYNNSIPNFPHFRIDEEEICDSTISWVPGFPTMKELTLEVVPNPVNSIIEFRVDDRYKWTNWQIININGMLIRKGKAAGWNDFKISGMDELVSGIYFIQILSEEGKVAIDKIVKE